jgi:4-hydroxy-2-oxoheptanedioate aldolase
MMRANRVKQQIRDGQASVGVFQNAMSPSIAELFGLVGFDFLCVDAEHGPMAVESCEAMIRAADGAGIPTLVRIAENSPQNILRYLDAGALGVQIPMVNTAEQAMAVVNAVKYPPVGRRGLAAVRANGWGLGGNLGDYTRQANAETLVVIQVETREAIENLDAILAVDGVDIVFLGPTDLSTSLGYPGEPNRAEVQEVIGGLIERIHAAGLASGTVAYDSAAIARVKQRGVQFILGGLMPLLVNASRAYLAEVRG